MKNIQNFIEKYYPNYDSCNDIAENEDLRKLINNEHQKGDDADRLRIKKYPCPGDVSENNFSINDFAKSELKILQLTIKSFIENIPKHRSQVDPVNTGELLTLYHNIDLKGLGVKIINPLSVACDIAERRAEKELGDKTWIKSDNELTLSKEGQERFQEYYTNILEIIGDD